MDQRATRTEEGEEEAEEETEEQFDW